MQAFKMLNNSKLLCRFKNMHLCTRNLQNIPKLYNGKSILRATIPMETSVLSRYLKCIVNVRHLCNPVNNSGEVVDPITFEQVCEETLDSLCEYFEELVDSAPHLKTADVAYSDGVLTVTFGKPYGTYVINRQSPNRQIWLSSPTSGPKRYDYCTEQKFWVYKHDGVSLHKLLQTEISKIVKADVDFSKHPYSGL